MQNILFHRKVIDKYIYIYIYIYKASEVVSVCITSKQCIIQCMVPSSKTNCGGFYFTFIQKDGKEYLNSDKCTYIYKYIYIYIE